MNSYIYLKNRTFNNKKEKIILENNLDYSKYSSATSKEWNNSVYTYNKNSIKNLPVINKTINKIMVNYFDFFNSKIERKLRILLNEKRELKIKFRRSSIQKIFISKTTTKHFINKIVVTIYTFNQQKRFILENIKKQLIAFSNKDNIKKKRLEFINFVIFSIIKQENNINKNKLYLFYLNKMLEQEMLNIYYKKLLYINTYKFTDIYLNTLKDIFSNLYNKRVEFNIINLKVIYSNSDILAQSMMMKIKKTKKNIIVLLDQFLSIVKLPDIYKYIWKPNLPESITNTTKNSNKSELLTNLLSFNEISNNVEHKVLNSIKYKLTNGIRLEIAGRISKRSSSNRSMFKFKYKGNIRNIDSSFRGISTGMLRGHVKSNIQYTNLNSKIRNGAYGFKGWVSSV
jgi:hypothetical protein